MAQRSQEQITKLQPLQVMVLLYLVALFPGDLQVSCFPVQSGNFFPIKKSTLDMALTSFDDQYKGCTEEMEAELGELNHTEFASNRVYAEAWKEAASRWTERKASLPALPRDLKPEYAIAIMTYTSQGRFHRDFNAAVREAGGSRDSYLTKFNFKAFHFLLTRALHALAATGDSQCHKVYRGVRGIHFLPNPLRPVRFGHFTSSSLRYENALRFGNDTFFTIKTCHGVSIQNFSFFPEEQEVLIPPFETFKVANFTRARDATYVQLLSLKDSSFYNCVLVKEKRCKTRRCNFIPDAALSHFSIHVQFPCLLSALLLLAVALGHPGLL